MKRQPTLDNPELILAELKRHETTQYEIKVLIKLVLRLQHSGFVGDIYKNVPFVYKDRLHIPDIYIPKAGLVVEVDGRFHESNSRQIKMDSYREDFFLEGFRLAVWTIPNYSVHHNWGAHKELVPLVNYCLNHTSSREDQESAHNQLVAGRARLEKAIPGIFAGNGEELKCFNKEYEGKIGVFKHFGGLRITIYPPKIDTLKAA